MRRRAAHALGRPRAIMVDGRAVAVRYDAARRVATITVPSSVRHIDVEPAAP
jgi:YD repeat-containing protein